MKARFLNSNDDDEKLWDDHALYSPRWYWWKSVLWWRIPWPSVFNSQQESGEYDADQPWWQSWQLKHDEDDDDNDDDNDEDDEDDEDEEDDEDDEEDEEDE